MVLWLALGSRRRFWEQAFTFGSMVLTNAVELRQRVRTNNFFEQGESGVVTHPCSQ